MNQEEMVPVVKGIVIFLACTLLCYELYDLFPKKVYRHFYPLAPDSLESIRWYVTGLTDRFVWFGTMITWLLTFRLTTKDRQEIYPVLVMLTIYRGMDFVIYPLNHSHAGAFYGIVYVPIIIYAIYTTFRKQIWTAAERIYSKTKKNGNHSDR